jgi:hypothetical protein
MFNQHRQQVRYRLSFEFLVVDWNSDASQASVAHSIRSTCLLFLPLRVIIVPATLHASLYNPAAVSMLLLTAKNVGARRARGSFLLFTNADDIFPPKLLLRLTASTLLPGRVYRAMRWEVHAAVEQHVPVDYSAFFSEWGHSDPSPAFASMLEMGQAARLGFRSSSVQYEV